jgi:hypothetical protein
VLARLDLIDEEQVGAYGCPLGATLSTRGWIAIFGEITGAWYFIGGARLVLLVAYRGSRGTLGVTFS